MKNLKSCFKRLNFLLVYAGIDHFDKNKKITDYTTDDILWARPKLDDEYFDDIITVFGHTPTMHYGSMYKGKIIKTKTWMDIDVGVSAGNEPILL